MNTKNLLYTLLMAMFVLSFSACDDESAFEGSDNYLASFALIQNGKQYTGVISEGEIVVTIPDTLELSNVTALYTCSEHATLSPDPASIEDWEQKQTFTVTSYNGRSQNYNYTLKRSAITLEEGVNLRNDAEIAAFAEKQISRIEGSLIIGMKEAFSKEDSITTLAPLASLKEVTGNIKIYASFNGTSLEGLENLEHVGGIELVYPENNNNSRPDFKNLRRIELNALTTVDSDLKLIADTVDIFNLPQLAVVGRHIWLEGNGIRNLQAPKLNTIGGDFLLGSARWYGNWAFDYLEEVSLPELTTVSGSFSIKRTEQVKKCLLPKLASVTGFEINTSKLEVLDINQLAEVVGALRISSMPLTELNLSQLKKVDELQFQNLSALKELRIPIQEISGKLQINSLPLLETLSLNELKKVGGDFQIQSCPLIKDLNTLSKLTEVGGKFTLSNMNGLNNSDGFRSLTTVGGDFALTISDGIAFDYSGFDALTRIGGNFWMAGDGMQTTLNAFNNLKSIGGAFTFQGLPTVTAIEGFNALQSCGANRSHTFNTLPNVTDLSRIFEKMKGNTVTTIQITTLPLLANLDIRGISIGNLYLYGIEVPLTIKGDAVTSLALSHQGGNTLNLEGMEEIGSLTLNGAVPSTTSMSFDGLKRIKGQLSVYLSTNVPNMEKISFPNLVTISNNLTISGRGQEQKTAIELPILEEVSQGSVNYSGMTEVNLPKLRKVGAQLFISTADEINQQLTMLKSEDIHLPMLESVGTLTITSNTYVAEKFNNTLTNLNFLPNLKEVTSSNNNSVQISRQTALTDFTALKTIIEGLTQASQWSVSNNAYNPTFEEAKAGKLKQE